MTTKTASDDLAERLAKRSPEFRAAFLSYFTTAATNFGSGMRDVFGEALDRVVENALTLLHGLERPALADLQRVERLSALQVAENVSTWNDCPRDMRGKPRALANELLATLASCRPAMAAAR